MKFISQKTKSANYTNMVKKYKKQYIENPYNKLVNKKNKRIKKIKKVVKLNERVNNNNIINENDESLYFLNSENNERICNNDLNINNICKEKKQSLTLIWDYENPCEK